MSGPGRQPKVRLHSHSASVPGTSNYDHLAGVGQSALGSVETLHSINITLLGRTRRLHRRKLLVRTTRTTLPPNLCTFILLVWHPLDLLHRAPLPVRIQLIILLFRLFHHAQLLSLLTVRILFHPPDQFVRHRKGRRMFKITMS